MRLFHKDEDYAAFERVLAEGLERYPVELFTYCLMPNHWHLVVRPRDRRGPGALAGLGRRDARAAPSRALPSPRRRAPVPGPVQELSGRERRALSDVLPLRGGQPAACEAGRAGRALALERTVAAAQAGDRPAAGPLAACGGRPIGIERVNRALPRDDDEGLARMRPARPPVGRRGVGPRDRRPPGPGFHPPRPRSPEKEKSVMSLMSLLLPFPSSGLVHIPIPRPAAA